jgi:hypothetical protein
MSVAPRPPQYKGGDLDAAKGPGLGCFWIQVAVLAVLVVATPLGVVWGWPAEVTVGLLALTIVLLFFVGQTAIFLLRLVTAERRGRRRPMASRTPTVGELEDAHQAGASENGRSPASGEDGSEAGAPPRPMGG